MDWAQILVIILGVVLAIFLALAIALVVLLIKVTRQIKSVTASAQRTAEHFEHAVSGVGKVTSPLMIMKAIISRVNKSKKRRR